MTTATAIPESPEQLEEAFHDEGLMQNIFAEGNFGKFTHAYMKMFVSKQTEDVKAFKEQAQADMANFMRVQADKNGARPAEGFHLGAAAAGQGSRRARAVSRSKLRDSAAAFDRNHLFGAKADGAQLEDTEYGDNLRQFIWATLKGEVVASVNGDQELVGKLQAMKGSLAKQLEIRNAASMSERIPSEGGFLVPENLRSEILALTIEQSIARSLATVIPMDSLRVPIPTIDDTSHVSSVYGGVAGAWTAEGAALSATAPSFARLNLIASKLTAYTEIPSELLQDSASPMDVWFNTFFPQALGFFEDVAFLTGDGVDSPLGIINAPGAVTINEGSAVINYATVVSMFAQMWPGSLKDAVWLAAPDAIPSLAQMAVSSGGTTVAPPVFLPGMSAVEGSPGNYDGRAFTLLGRPGYVSEKIPAAGAAGNLAFVDFSKYLIGDRQALQIASSAEYKFGNDVVAYRVIERLDGRPWVQSAITPNNGGNKLSPYVMLGTAA